MTEKLDDKSFDEEVESKCIKEVRFGEVHLSRFKFFSFIFLFKCRFYFLFLVCADGINVTFNFF